ncbi:hypothetical protein N0V84_004851 [Fusarium piperis]|uniref:Uncharacterized protein n=1 Tax=Fusarium piperis TaxID=1435070 RepID=A0A9W8WF74_9HYPO|nr:hypothetical protein N0V84_004851 [Fusarium piperis]
MVRQLQHIAGLRLLLIFLMAEMAAAADDSEFAFNFFTDIAPLLALFGEQFARQFLSESLSFEDHIIIAVVPLGILTIITNEEAAVPEATTGTKDHQPPADQKPLPPNMQLNLVSDYIKQKAELRWAVAVAIIVQLGLLVLAGVVAFYGPLKDTKDFERKNRALLDRSREQYR